MGYLFTQILLWLVIAAALGVFVGWLIWGRRREEAKPDYSAECQRLRSSLNSVNAQLNACREKLAEAEKAAESKPVEAEPEPVAAPQSADEKPVTRTPSSLGDDEPAPDSWKPALLAEARGDKDDLKRIKGIGTKIEGILNNLGIYHFSQIADFTEENVAWVNSHLRFKGRIQREKWIEQAKQLAAEK